MSEQLESILTQIAELQAQRELDRQQIARLSDEIVKLNGLLDAAESRYASHIPHLVRAIELLSDENQETRTTIERLQRVIRRLSEF